MPGVGLVDPNVGYAGPGDLRTHLWNDHSTDLQAIGISYNQLYAVSMDQIQQWHNQFHAAEMAQLQMGGAPSVNVYQSQYQTVAYQPQVQQVAYQQQAVYQPQQAAYEQQAVYRPQPSAYQSQSVAYDPQQVVYPSQPVYQTQQVVYQGQAVTQQPQPAVYSAPTQSYEYAPMAQPAQMATPVEYYQPY
jgi:hypothetical protein